MIILTISRSSSNMGNVGSKTRSVVQIKSIDAIVLVQIKHCEHSVDELCWVTVLVQEAKVLVQSSNLLRMIILTISQLCSNMGDVGSKNKVSRSNHRINIVSTIEATVLVQSSYKLAQNDHLDKISVKFEYGSCGVKNKVRRSTDRKILWTLQRPQFRSNLYQTCSRLNMDHVGSKSRSVGQII